MPEPHRVAPLVVFALRHMLRYLVRRAVEFRRRDIWNIGIIAAPVHEVALGRSNWDVDWLPPGRRGTFRADPFAVKLQGEAWVVYEHFDYSLGVGEIRLCGVTGREDRRAPCQAPVHFSYPYIFEDQGQVYCMPETHQSRDTWIWHLQDAMNWRKSHQVLPGLPLVDATLFWHEGYWWLFGALATEQPLQTLFAWYSTSIDGGWHAHPMNPIKTSPKSSRPAGAPFVHEGRTYRPAQDCRVTYGGAIVINELLELSPTAFHEVEVNLLRPLGGLYSGGLHTINAVGQEATVIDGKFRERVLIAPFRKSRRRDPLEADEARR